MTRSELKEYFEDSNFKYVCKVRGQKKHLRYNIGLDSVGSYSWGLWVNYNENHISLCGYRGLSQWVEPKFKHVYCYDLDKAKLTELLQIFIPITLLP